VYTTFILSLRRVWWAGHVVYMEIENEQAYGILLEKMTILETEEWDGESQEIN
jgi:hypothetical protein